MLADHLYIACGPFTKNKERMQKFKNTGNLWCIYQSELDKACFQQDMAYEDFKGLTRRTAPDEIFPGKAHSIVKTPKYDEYQRGPVSMV